MSKKVRECTFTYIETFAGIGGFRQALDKLGGQCVLSSEIDKFANQAYEVLYGEPTAGDITQIDAKDVPDHDLLVGGFPCFAEGTLITTSDGLKPIEKVRKGDKVLTHTNTFKDVVVPMVKRKKGIYELKVQGSPSTLITEEHPVFVREMSRQWDNEKRAYVRVWSEPKWVETKDLKKGVHFVGMSENNNASNPLNITHEEAWLIGRYVADGYIKNDNENNNEAIVFCVGKDKIQEFEQEVNNHYVGITEDKHVFRCRINTKRLNSFCKKTGRGAINKRIPGFILNLPINILERFLDGYMSGDGCLTNGGYQATSVSRELIYGLAQIVQKLYNTPYSITYSKRPKTTAIEGRTVNQNDTWMIRFRKENRKQQDGVYIDGMLWMPVRSLVYNEDFEGNVYNFEVEGDNSYVANNLTVHNCQAFSVAGKRLGFDDTRGTLFFEVARIAREKQPKAILLENVKGLVGHDKGKTLDTIVKTLNEIGYTVDFEVLNSKYFGVPQNRERIFIIAVRDDLIDSEPWIIEGNTVVPKGKRRISGYSGEDAWNLKTFNFEWPTQESVTTKLRDILETEVDEKYYLDDEKTAKLVAQLEAKKPGERMSRQAVETFNESEQPKEHGDIIQAYNRQHLKDGICPTLTTRPEGFKTASLPIVEGIAIKEATKKGYAIAEEGDSVNVQFPDSKTRRGRVGKQIANTLEASNINQGVVMPKYRIRKLTPKECFRLQAFPDEAHDALEAAGISNSQRYKMAGNAITVNVVEAIGERLLRFL